MWTSVHSIVRRVARSVEVILSFIGVGRRKPVWADLPAPSHEYVLAQGKNMLHEIAADNPEFLEMLCSFDATVRGIANEDRERQSFAMCVLETYYSNTSSRELCAILESMILTDPDSGARVVACHALLSRCADYYKGNPEGRQRMEHFLKIVCNDDEQEIPLRTAAYNLLFRIVSWEYARHYVTDPTKFDMKIIEGSSD